MNIEGRRVVVTGLGPVTAIGIGKDPFWAAALEGRTSVAPIPESWYRYYPGFRSRIWSPLSNFDPAAHGIGRKEARVTDRATHVALAATRLALSDAGFSCRESDPKDDLYEIEGIDPLRTSVVMGTGVGGHDTFTHFLQVHVQEGTLARLEALSKEIRAAPGSPGDPGPGALADRLDTIASYLIRERFHPFIVSMLMPNAPGGRIGIKYGIRGENHTVATACAAGTMALGEAFRAIRADRADLVISGGVEIVGGGEGYAFRGFDVAGTVTRRNDDPDHASRPFDRDRDGFLFSEGGGAVLILEEISHARRRGARIYAEIAGYGTNLDAYSIMQLNPTGEQIERMIRGALREAGENPASVDYFNAHGTGTELNDDVEARVISRVFGPAPRLWVNSTKSLLGHSIGASGAIEAAAACLSLSTGKVHPSRNIENPIAPFRFPKKAEEDDLKCVVSTSYGFAGHNACLVLRKLRED